MKNFTKQNFKTNPLWIRLLIMTFMLLAGAGNMWAAKVYFENNKGWTNILIYYWGGSAGSVNWDNSPSMTKTGDKLEGYDVYSYDFGSNAPGNIIFRGKNGNNYEQTVNITYSANKCWKLNAKGSDSKYSVTQVTYSPTQSATFSFSLPELYVGTPATITYSLSPSNAGSVSFLCTTSNATISGNQITANSSGTVTVKATIKYNSGYSGTTTTSKSTTAYIPAETKLYLKPTGWTDDNAKFSAYFFTGTSTNQWKAATVVCNATDVYEVELPSGKWTNLIWCRMDPNVNQPDWSGSWGQTVDLTYEGKNLYTITNAYGCGDNKGCGDWSNYTPPPCCTTLDKPSLTKTNIELCNGDPQNYGTIKISNYNSSYSYTLNNNAVTPFKVGDTWYIADDIEVAGDYTVTVDVSGSCESKTATINIPAPTDNTPAIGDFRVTSSTSATCSETKVTLEATNVNGASYQWFLNDSQEPISGATSRIYEPTITANATYKVVVSKTSKSCTATKNASVNVTAIPVPSTNDFDITIPENPVYNGQKHSATATVKSGITGMGAVTVKHYKNSSEVDPIDAGDYVVKMSVAAGDSYCAMSETEIGTFTIAKASQSALIISTASTNICGKEATFTVTGGDGTGDYSYSLDKNDAGVSLKGTTLTATQNGSVTLKVKKLGDNNYNESKETTKEFNFTMPIEDVTLTKVDDGKTTYCVGDKAEFKLTYSGPYPTSYEWSGSAMGSLEATGKTAKVLDNGASWYIDFTEAKTYTIALSLTGCNTDASEELSFTVNAIPDAPSLTNPEPICYGESIILPEKDANKKTITWVGVDNRTLTGLTVGSHTYTAKIVENGCESSTVTYTITVKEQLAKPTLSVTNIIKCGSTHTDGKIVIENYNNANTYVLKKDSKPIDKTYKEGYLITKDEVGSYTVEVSKDGACGATSDAKTIVITDNTPTVNDFNISVSATVCEGNPFTMSYDGTAQSGEISYAWYEGAINEVLGRESSFEVAQAKNTTYKLKITVTSNDCSAYKESTITIEPKQRPNAPTFDSKEMSVCVNEQFTLPVPTNLQDGEDGLWTVAGQPTTQGQTLTEAGTYTYTAYINNGCPSDGTDFTVHVNPLPTITLTADNETVNVGETVTLSVSGSDFTELKWSATDGTKSYTVTPGVNNTATITTDENALITVTVVAKSFDGCETSASIDLTFGSEDCRVSNADYIEILCRRTNDKESATADRDMHCYAWITGTTGTLLGGWPGVKTENVDFEYKGKKYAVWHIKSDAEVSIIFNNNNDDQKTGDIPGHVKGYRYVYTLSSDYKTATLYEEPSLINMPEVRTISVTSERQANGDLKVYMSGKILKKGCAVIKSYGFQYKKDNGDYTGTAGIVENTDKNAGFVFTAETTLTKGNYGEYTFRARLINENSTKVYGEEFKIYFYESDVFIEAVGGDKQVTNKSGVYYDFVGLYVKNVTVPAGVSISRYKWFKGDVEYNAGNATVADRGVSSSSNNIRPNEAGTYTCEVTLSNGDILESNEIEVSATNTYSEVVTSKNRNLPVISVRTNEAFPTCETAGTTGAYPSTNIEGWKEKRSVDVKIFNADGTLYYDRKARMNYRGSSSLNFNKKSYAFCPGEENCGQEKDKTPDYVTTTTMNLFGLSDGAKDKDWVLYAAAADPTLMRNRIVFDTYADMTGKWGVDSKYVELVIDGVYQGVYVLMDKITNNEKRVNITDPNGFIVKFDKTDIADREADLLDAGQEVGDEKTFQTKRTGRVGIQTYNTFVDQLFEIEYPEKKKVVKNGGDWSTTLSAIKQKFEEFETALADGDYIKVRSLIDYESWADWFIINEFTKNVDAYRASCVFVYNGNKIEAQPLWDQELSFNNAAGANIGKKGANKTTGLLIENNGVYTDCFPAPFWWTGSQSSFNNCGTNDGESTISSEKIQNYLLKDECFVATIKDRWDTHTEEGGALHKDKLMAKYSALLTELGAAKDREITKWPSNHRVADACDGPGTGYNDVTFDDSETALKNWINKDLVEISSESESASRASNLNYLIENMEGEPLRFDLTLNPASGVTTPWIPITVTVEVPDGYEYTYDDSSIKANEGVIIKSSTDKYSYTFPRPENWNTGNQGEGNEIEPLFYEVNVSLNIETTETASCGESKFETSKTAIISLQDEGDDLCNYAD